MPIYTFPQTIYSVALYYTAAIGSEYFLTVRTVSVSGIDPLTNDEARARARQEIESNWPEGFKTAADWRFALAAVTRNTLERGFYL